MKRINKGFLGLGLLISSEMAVAADKTVPSATSQLSQVVAGLFAILLLIGAISWLAKRFSHGAFQQNGLMKVIASLPLGTRERLLLIEAGGTQILLGVTATQVQTLHVFPEPIQLPSNATGESEFAKKLMSIIQTKGIDTNSSFGSPSNNSKS